MAGHPNDGAAADLEASPIDVGLTRTRCVATMLKGGHADNALPQSATATVNCRIMPGIQPRRSRPSCSKWRDRSRGDARSQLYRRSDADLTPAPDVLAAVTKRSSVSTDRNACVPGMQAGASDGSFFRAQGIPVYDVDGSWGISPLDERAHGLDERLRCGPCMTTCCTGR